MDKKPFTTVTIMVMDIGELSWLGNIRNLDKLLPYPDKQGYYIKFNLNRQGFTIVCHAPSEPVLHEEGCEYLGPINPYRFMHMMSRPAPRTITHVVNGAVAVKVEDISEEEADGLCPYCGEDHNEGEGDGKERHTH